MTRMYVRNKNVKTEYGRIVSETESSVMIVDEDGKYHLIAKADAHTSKYFVSPKAVKRFMEALK